MVDSLKAELHEKTSDNKELSDIIIAKEKEVKQGIFYSLSE